MTGRKAGRPCGGSDSRQKIIDASVSIMSEEGADRLTVRRICEVSGLSTGTFYHFFADKSALMMSFVSDPGFRDIELKSPEDDIAARVTELYGILVKRYVKLGEGFMRAFYTADNTALASYTGADGGYGEQTVTGRCLAEICRAVEAGYIDGDAEEMTADVCTIVKGCVFDRCLTRSRDVFDVMQRLIRAYFAGYGKAKN